MVIVFLQKKSEISSMHLLFLCCHFHLTGIKSFSWSADLCPHYQSLRDQRRNLPVSGLMEATMHEVGCMFVLEFYILIFSCIGCTGTGVAQILPCTHITTEIWHFVLRSFYTGIAIHSLLDDGTLGPEKEVHGFPDGAMINFVSW